MGNKEMIISLIQRNGKNQVLACLKWMPKIKGAKTQDEAIQCFLDFCVNDFDEVIKFGTTSYICKSRKSPVDCANALLSSNAMSNYFTSKL